MAKEGKKRTCELQNFGGQVFENSRCIDGSFSSDAYIVLCTLFQVPMNTTNRELQRKTPKLSDVDLNQKDRPEDAPAARLSHSLSARS